MMYRVSDTIPAVGLTFALLLSGCGPRVHPNQSGFVTKLGDDTLAVESFRLTDSGMEAQVALRSPITTVQRYDLQLDEDGRLVAYTAEIRSGDAPPDADPRRREVAALKGDSLEITVTENGETEVRVLPAGQDALPFIDMVHWPFELMLTRARAAGADSTSQPLFTPRGSMEFAVADLAPDSMTVTHPFRGTMMVDVDPEGRLLRLDAAHTTRKLVVERVDDVDIEGVAARFVQLEAEGRAFGPLSGRGETMATVDGAMIRVDFGRPSKRGREIWGALVPYGEVWRTGANRATHVETDRPLRVGNVDVPAGTFTLYSIPEADGGVLIINQQTGQGGTTYDEDMDFGRVPMQRSELSESVEDFTIEIEDTPEGGAIHLIWDRSRFTVPFTVRSEAG